MNRAASSISQEMTCQGKATFTSFSLAAAAARRKDKRHVYHCRWCHGFHVGSFVSKPQKRLKERHR